MVQDISKLIDDFLSSHNEMTAIRLELDGVVNEIESATENHVNVEKEVNQGLRYSDELETIRSFIDSKKISRDEISKALKAAVEKTEAAERATLLPVGNKVIELWSQAQASERELRKRVDALRDFTESLPRVRWLWYRSDLSPRQRTVICTNGLRENIFNDGDVKFFERLKEELIKNE